MDTKKLLKDHQTLIIFLIAYLIVRIFIFNINYTEWGDTFRMIRAADYISNLSWPWDEKRWPFYSVLLVPGIWINAPVFWGRIISLIVSVGSLIAVYFFYLKYISQNKTSALLASVITATTSVFGYWSIRVMADPLFAFLVLIYFYFFPDIYKTKNYYKKEWGLSILLLAITMTRLEGLFVAVATGAFFLVYSIQKFKFDFKLISSNFVQNFRSILIFFTPQILIYFPWTLYAKVLYKGNVNNNYLDEVQTFVFNFERFKYFITYTAFILVVPLTLYFLFSGVNALKKTKGKEFLYFLPLVLFIAQEFLIGFIWTPSLPRIYMPVIPFLVILLVYGMESYKLEKVDIRKYLLINILLTGLFAYWQYEQKLYFLGASKLLFAIIIFSNLALLTISILKNKYAGKVFICGFIALNLLITGIVIHNQSLIYKSVMKGIEFVAPLEGEKAYSDETGNTEWYLRTDGVYLHPEIRMGDTDKQYGYLKSNGIEYMLWTNEFNRGSMFTDPKADPRFQLLYIYQQPIRDPLEMLADRMNLLEDDTYTIFVTKVYRVL